MKTMICLARDIHSIYALNLLAPSLKNDCVKLFFSPPPKSKPDSTAEDFKKISFLEYEIPNNFIFPMLDNLDKVSEKFLLTPKQISKKFQIEILHFNNINDDGLQYLEKNWKPDIILSIRFAQIFQQPIINLPKFGIINLHSGILPFYRGIIATFWALLNEEKKIGTTLHFINNKEIDQGDIIDINTVPASHNKSLINQVFDLYPSAIKMTEKALHSFRRGFAPSSSSQNHQKSSYFSFPQQDDFNKFKEKYKIWDSDEYQEITHLFLNNRSINYAY